MDKENTNKIIGYLLLVVGLGIIAYSAINVFNVFKGRTQPFDLFSFSSISLDFSDLTGDQPLPEGVNLEQELIEKDLLNQPINLIAHLMLMGFFSTIGFKIAQLGTTLARTIKVKVIGRKEE